MRIAISPDENPGDPGAVSPDGIQERDLNVKVAEALLAELTRNGQDAWFDPNITYVDRVAKANADGTDLLIACAHNAGGGEGLRAVICSNGHVSQTPTWFDGRPNRQDALAGTLGDEMFNAGLITGSPSWSFVTEDVYEACSFQFDTLYAELLFMDSPHDHFIYTQVNYPERAAGCLARAISRVYGWHYSSPPPPPPPLPPPPPPLPGVDVGKIITELAAITDAVSAIRAALPAPGP